MSTLSDTLARGHFAITAEITPPLSANAGELLSKASVLNGKVDAINVTDGASAQVHMSSLAAAVLLHQSGLEPVLQVTCRDRNRISLQSDLLGAAAMGIENLLILRGDDPDAGDQPETKAVFDYQSRDLMECARHMQESGELPSGRTIDSPPSFFIGAADIPMNPTSGDWSPEGLQAKVRAGAKFIQTQFCFDADLVREYAAALKSHGISEHVNVLMGIGPLASAKSALWMRSNLWGTNIPDTIIERMESAADEKAEGITICADLITEYADIDGISGVHLMAPLGIDAIPIAIEQSGLRI
ncbi:MAG: methylenetetrahydrofolate reductase [Pseudomonadota bacterium]|nr:methylenetetrahydrofolate reductase [Pseudomonadota bacterium]